MKKKLVPFFLFILGLSLFLYPHIAHYINDYGIQQDINRFQMASAHPLDSNQKDELYDDMLKYNQSLNENSETTITDVFTDDIVASNPFYQSDGTGKMSGSEGLAHSHLFGSSFYFYIHIPKINVELPIYVGESENNLLKGAVVVSGSSLPLGGSGTHAVLAAHRGAIQHRMFLHLDRLDKGDIFEVHTMEGPLVYQVTGTKVVYPNEVDTLSIKKDKDLVTLVTCLKYPMNDRRLLVYGERVH
ncbi:class C sortase [Alkalibacterium iburiense]|uniref:Class C sortase n=1 Tax=Alkalibacterium iburiense TaxID=290589 RepID=A0ABP3HG38_9LACT